MLAKNMLPAPDDSPAASALTQLCHSMARLRSPGGCPWDAQQTHASLKSYLLEECYEVLAAIESGEPQALREELGDLFLQILFHAQIAGEAGHFELTGVFRALQDKLVRRHPHVFGGKAAPAAEDFHKNWERLKAQEKPPAASRLASLPAELPALLYAYRLGAKAGSAGLDWERSNDVLPKIQEELKEFEEAVRLGDKAAMELELGDLLFSLSQLARHFKIQPELALRASNQKFQRRFEWIEEKARREDRALESLSAEQWEALWQEAKRGA